MTPPNKIPTADLLADIRRVADELGHNPSLEQYREHGRHSDSTLARRFGSWADAKREAGFDSLHAGPVSDADLIADLERVADEVGRSPTRREYRDLGDYNTDTFDAHFGSWNEAKTAAGMERYEPSRSRVSREELLADLERVADLVGGSPATTDYAEHGRYTLQPFKRAFGSWRAAKRKAGYEALHPGPVTDAELLADLERVADELGRSPSMREYADHGEYAPSTVQDHFDTWDTAKREAGLELVGGPRHELEQLSPEDVGLSPIGQRTGVVNDD